MPIKLNLIISKRRTKNYAVYNIADFFSRLSIRPNVHQDSPVEYPTPVQSGRRCGKQQDSQDTSQAGHHDESRRWI